MNKLLLRLLFLSAMVIGLFVVADAVSAQTCCLVNQREELRRAGQRVQATITKPNRAIDCRIITQGNCNTTPREEVVNTDPNTHRRWVEVTSEESISCLAHAFCATDASNVTDCSQFDGNTQLCLNATSCFPAGSECLSRYDDNVCSKLPREFCGTDQGNQLCLWRTLADQPDGACYSRLEAELLSRYDENSSRLLPSCATAGVCRDANDLLRVVIKAAQFLFSLIGGLAFVVFVIGGVRFITSFGNAEKVKAAQQMIVAAVVGLIIAFSAFFLIDFVLDSLDVGGDERSGVTASELRGGIN